MCIFVQESRVSVGEHINSVYFDYIIVEVMLTLKGEPEVDEERVLQLSEYVDLPQNVLEGVPLQALRLVHVLHGVHLLRVLLLDYAHLHSLPNRVNVIGVVILRIETFNFKFSIDRTVLPNEWFCEDNIHSYSY